MPFMRFPLVILAICLLTGCSSSADNAQSVIVNNPFDGRLESAPIELSVDQVFGAEEEPTREVLSRVRDVEVDPAGNVYVLGDDRVVSFAPDGSFRWEINQQGDGPGELGRATGMALHPRGDLYVNNQFYRGPADDADDGTNEVIAFDTMTGAIRWRTVSRCGSRIRHM